MRFSSDLRSRRWLLLSWNHACARGYLREGNDALKCKKKTLEDILNLSLLGCCTKWLCSHHAWR